MWGFGAQAAELRIVFLTGEVVADYALRLKATHGVERTWVAGARVHTYLLQCVVGADDG